MRDVLVDTEGFNQYYEELNRLKDLSLSIASIGSESYADAVGDGWHDNFAFEDTMRESRKIASRIDKMIEDEKYLKIVDKKRTSDDITRKIYTLCEAKTFVYLINVLRSCPAASDFDDVVKGYGDNDTRSENGRINAILAKLNLGIE